MSVSELAEYSYFSAEDVIAQLLDLDDDDNANGDQHNREHHFEPATEAREVKKDVDDDEEEMEPPKPCVSDRLHWRLDRDESLSDWTIEVIVTTVNDLRTMNNRDEGNDKSVIAADAAAASDHVKCEENLSPPAVRETYHVHRHQLAVGRNSSGYFSRLFGQGGRFSESQQATSRIPLHPLAAAAVPLMLDFLYVPFHLDSLNLSLDNATALHWLGQYFEIPRLRWDAYQFCRKNLTPETCGTYYEHAYALQDTKILKLARKFCKENIGTIPVYSTRLVHLPDPTFWLELFEERKSTEQEYSLADMDNLSKLVNAFCVHNEHQLDAETFKQLTEESNLLWIHSYAALSLLDLEQKIVSPDPATLSSLQERCIDALVRDWKTAHIFAESLPSPSMDRLQQMNPLVFRTLFVRSLQTARDEFHQLEKKSEMQFRLYSMARKSLREMESSARTFTS